MIELVKLTATKRLAQRQLLMSVSAAALVGVICGNNAAFGSDEDGSGPTAWIELGGQFSQHIDNQEAFSPVFLGSPPRPPMFSSSVPFEHAPRTSFDGTGKLSIEPSGTNLVFSAGVRYGRSQNKKKVHQQTNPNPFVKYYYTSFPSAASGHISKRLQHQTAFPNAAKFSDTAVTNSEQHLVLDFQAGKDVGLGLFGGQSGSSVVSVGIRFAQFISKSNIVLKSDPDWKFHYKYFASAASYGFLSSKFETGQVYHSNQASLQASRSFHGIGPSLSWNVSAPILGSGPGTEVTIDWGINAAVLFGRQRVKVHHQTTGSYHGAKYGAGSRVVLYHPTPKDLNRSRSVTVPNLGGFAGLSFRYADAKVSFGYKADFFFGAMDGGIDNRQSETLGFHGPFATISVGLGG